MELTPQIVESIVISTMNILEKEYGADCLFDFGIPTTNEIVETICDGIDW